MAYIEKRAQTEIGRKIEELAGKVPAPLSWLMPDPYDPTNFIQPIGGLTKSMGNKYLQGLLERVKSGRIPAFHGTTMEKAERIATEGFKGVDFQDVLKETYEKFGLSLEQINQIPKKVRNFIESDARSRIINKEGGVISFAPTRSVAERWAGKGGEVAHETYKRLSEWFAGKAKGMTDKQFLNSSVLDMRVPYTELGTPAVIKAEIPINERTKQTLSHRLEWLTKEIAEGENPRDVLRSFLENYMDIRVPEEGLAQTKILKILPKRTR